MNKCTKVTEYNISSKIVNSIVHSLFKDYENGIFKIKTNIPLPDNSIPTDSSISLIARCLDKLFDRDLVLPNKSFHSSGKWIAPVFGDIVIKS